MPKKVVHRYPENFQTIVLEKLIHLDESMKATKETLREHTSDLRYVSEELKSMRGGLNAVQGQLGDIPAIREKLNKTYDIVVELVGDARVDREERLFLTRRVRNHDERLEVVESALSIKPSAGAF